MEDGNNKESTNVKSVMGRDKIIKYIILGAGITIFAGLIIFGTVLTVGIYKYGWEGTVSKKAIQALPYPVASVNGESIRYSELIQDMDTLKRFFDSQVAEGAPAESIPTEEELRENSLERLIFNKILEQQAKKMAVTVTDEEIEASYNELVEQSGGEENVKEELLLLYGWGIDQFKLKVLRPYLLQQNMELAFAEDETMNVDAKEKAMQVLAELEAGEDFKTLARLYSDDPGSAEAGGELGSFGRGVMVPEFEEAAFSLEIGEVSDLIRTKYGYHILTVTDQVESDGEVTEVSASHILIATKNLQDFLQEKREEANVEIYID